MNTSCFVGTTDPANPHLVHARFVLVNGHPGVVVPTLATIWAAHVHRDTQALIGAVLTRDWEYLDPATTANTVSGMGQHPVPGVGIPLTDADPDCAVDTPEPVTVFPLCRAGHLDAQWIYLLDPATDTVAVHTDDGHHLARYRLRDCVSPSAGPDPARRPASGTTATAPCALVSAPGTPL
ncbi:hypothetical protein [Micromonospora sp. 4G55]|uniref:hypothetical protein n=1 Tax=Micromonospora sp. 4G55 TaxID=2806102 RepID=UPI001EE4B1CD|nr:hypothetical protein [Micromonospora sp. 4G55]